MTVELTEQEWIIALNAMSLAPYREIQPLIQKISQQLTPKKDSAETKD